MPSDTMELFGRLNEEAHNELTYYRFNRNISLSRDYRRGVVSALKWMSELSRYYMNRESLMRDEFISIVQSELKKVERVADREYAQGVKEAIESIFSRLNISIDEE